MNFQIRDGLPFINVHLHIKQQTIVVDNVLTAKNVTIQIGNMDYGFDINGIIGSNVLIETGALLDFNDFTIECKKT